MTVVGNVSLSTGIDENELLRMKQAIIDLHDRMRELELVVFIDDDIDDSVIDPLEAGHQKLVAHIRAHEGDT